MLEDVFEGVHKLFPKKSPPVILQHSFLLNTKIAKLISERYVSKKLQLLLLGGKAKFYSIKTLKIAEECLQTNPKVSRIGICRCLIVSRSQMSFLCICIWMCVYIYTLHLYLCIYTLHLCLCILHWRHWCHSWHWSLSGDLGRLRTDSR